MGGQEWKGATKHRRCGLIAGQSPVVGGPASKNFLSIKDGVLVPFDIISTKLTNLAMIHDAREIPVHRSLLEKCPRTFSVPFRADVWMCFVVLLVWCFFGQNKVPKKVPRIIKLRLIFEQGRLGGFSLPIPCACNESSPGIRRDSAPVWIVPTRPWHDVFELEKGGVACGVAPQHCIGRKA